MIKTLAILLSILIFSSPVMAIDSTSSATSSVSDETVRDNLENRIKNIVKENLSTTEALLKERLNQISLVGYVGQISSISSESLTFQFGQDTFQIKTTDKTTYTKNGQVAKFTSLAIKDRAIIIGVITKKDIIEAKRIVVVKDEASTLPTVVAGTIVSLDTKNRKVIINSSGTDKTYIISRRSNLKLENYLPSKSILSVVHDQDAGQVITIAKVF